MRKKIIILTENYSRQEYCVCYMLHCWLDLLFKWCCLLGLSLADVFRFSFLRFLFFNANRSLPLQIVWCVLSSENNGVVYRERGIKKKREKKSCDTFSWLQTFRSKPFSRHWKKEKKRKVNESYFKQTLEVHIVALNFYDTRLCHIFMDKW